MKEIKWGIVGCGDVTEVKSGPALQNVEGSELVAVMRRSAEKAADYAKRHRVDRWYDDADALIEDPDVHAVYIATPPSSHKQYTVKAARAGKPVLVEKPMALTVRECEEMLEACDKAGVPLFVAYYRRKLPRFEKMRELIQDGAIGAPRVVSIRHFKKAGAQPDQSWKIDPAVNGGGFFVDMQTHTLDWLDHVFGPVEEATGSVSNQGQQYEAEDTVSLSMRFANGVLGSGVFAYSTNHEEEGVAVYGTEGHVTMGFFQPSSVQLVRDDRVEEFELPDPPHVHQPLVETVVAALNGAGSCPSTGETAIRTTRITEQILNP